MPGTRSREELLYLVRIRQQVVVSDKVGDILAVEEIAGDVNGSQAPINVVCRVGAKAEWVIFQQTHQHTR